MTADFWTLWERVRPKLESYARHTMDAGEDFEAVLGKTMLHLLRSFDKIEGDPERVFDVWAFKCCKQRMIEHWRKGKWEKAMPFDRPYCIEGFLDRRLALECALERLPEAWRRTLEMDATGAEATEGAAALGMTRPQYKNYLYRGRRMMERLLGEDVAA